MRKYFWQRWHNRKGRMARLLKLGISHRRLKQVSFYDGVWKAAAHPAMHQALSNQYLRRCGLKTAQDFASVQC